MLRLWIVTSSLFVASFCEDVNFYFGETCFSKNDNLKLTAVYTGSGTVTAVQWYYSNKTGTNLFVIASSCSIAGGLVPEGYPDESRMTLGCDEATKTFNLTLDGILEEELDKSWGATFSLSGDPSPDVKQMPISVCLTTTTTTSTTSTATSTMTTTTTPSTTTMTTPSTTTTTTSSTTTTPSTTTTTTPSSMTTTPTSTTPAMPITTTSMRMPITTSMPSTTSTTLTYKSTSPTKSSNDGLSDKMIIVIVIVPFGVIAIVGTVIFFVLFYRLQMGKRKPASHERHKQGKHYKGIMRSVQQHQQQPYIIYGRSHTRESNHKDTKRSRSLHYDDRYNFYDGYHWGSQVKQNPVYKGDRNLSRLYNNESLSGYDDYRSGYTKGHAYQSHTSRYQYRPDYHGDSRRHRNCQYPVYSRQQEYIDHSYSYMGY